MREKRERETTDGREVSGGGGGEGRKKENLACACAHIRSESVERDEESIVNVEIVKRAAE